MLDRSQVRINYAGIRKELQTIEEEYLPLLPAKMLKQYKELQVTQQTHKKDAVFMAAARMVRLLHVQYLKLIDDLQTNSPTKEFSAEKIFAGKPLMIPSKTIGKVYVFPNLIVDMVDKTSLRNVCWALCFDSLETFVGIRNTKPNSWRPFFRAWCKIKSYKEISLLRALARYTNIDSVLSYSEISKLEAAYIEALKPLELIYAIKPKDYITMFQSGGVGSCMTTNKEKAAVWEYLLKGNHHPMSLFAYHIYIKGVYCFKNKKVAARTLLYQVSSKTWEYGRIFAINSIYFEQFEESLKSAGYSALKHTFSRRVTFNVPGIKAKNDYLLPVPYMDNVENSINAKFDSKTKQFIVTFKCNPNVRNIGNCSTGGYIKASVLSADECDNCHIVGKTNHSSWNGMYKFCSVSCARDSGYGYAQTSTGDPQLRIIEECYKDFFSSVDLFTSRNSCKQCGGLPVIHNFTDKNGKLIAIQIYPEEFSRHGYVVTCNGTRYCVDGPVSRRLRKRQLINDRNSELFCSSKGVVKGVVG